MGAAVSELERPLLSDREIRRKEGKRKLRERAKVLGAKVGKGVGHVIVDFLPPTFIDTPYSKVQAIEGRVGRGIAKTLSEPAKALETSGAILLAIGAVVWAAPIALMGAGMYAVGRVPGEMAESFTNWRLKKEAQRRLQPPRKRG